MSSGVIKISENGQVKWVQSQSNCPLHSKQPLNLYWFCVTQHFQNSVHLPAAVCFLCFRWHCMLPSLRPLPHMPHCLCIWIPSPNTHHYIFFYFTSPPFSLWTSSLSPNILCARNTVISSLQKWKLKFWRCTLSLKCQMLHPEYQWLLFDACCRTATVPLLPVVAAPLKFDEALWGHRISSEVTPYVILVHYHFCQLSPLCKHALNFKEASPWLSTVQKHIMTGARGIVLQCAAYDRRATSGFLEQMFLPALFYSILTKCWSALH